MQAGASAIAQRALERIRRARGDAAHAARYLAGALENFQGCEAAFEAARTRLDLAELDAARGARAVACEHVTASIAAFQAANAPKRVAQARELARQAGLDVGSLKRDGDR